MNIAKIGAFCAEKPWRVIFFWGVGFFFLLGAAGSFGLRFNDRIFLPGSDSQQAMSVLEEKFPQQGTSATLVVRAREGSLDDAAEALVGLLRQVRAVPSVVGVDSPFAFRSPDGVAALGQVHFDRPASQLKESTNQLEKIAKEGRGPLEVAFGGEPMSMNTEPEPGATELIGLGIALLVLVVSFGSLFAALLPVVTAIVSVGVGIILIGLVGHWLDVSSAAPMLGSMLGLGVGIDYALFIVTRFREERRLGFAVHEAVSRSSASAGRAVLFAGASVGIALLGLAFSGVSLVAALGVASAIVVLISVFAALTLLPALLGLVGGSLERWRLPSFGEDGAFFARLARLVARRPGWFMIVSALFLLLASAPALQLRLGIPDDSAQPEGTSTRRAYDLISSHFGPGFSAPLVLAVEPSGSLWTPLQLMKILSAQPEVKLVAPPTYSQDKSAALFVVITKAKPDSEEVSSFVHRLRSEVLPETLLGTSSRAFVGGLIPLTIDMADSLAARIPLVMSAVLLSTFLLLVVVFRSILVPLKAVVMNLLSVGSAWGALVLVFQWGYGASWLGVERPLPIVSFLPMLLFALLFGLSMDYEVFLLSRIREEYNRGFDTTESVARALASTGRVISSAALIMVSIFLAFALGPDPMIKMFGVGLAVAILVDATIIRLVLVPATMVLLGERNWWLPEFLERSLPRVSIEPEHSDHQPLKHRSSPW